MSEKFCPMSFNVNSADHLMKCNEGVGCKWWISTYTTEGIFVKMCAIEAMALKNSEGKIPV